MTDLPECTCPLIDASHFGPRGIEVSFLLGDPRGSGCPIHETEEMRNEIKTAEHLARYGGLVEDYPCIPIKPDPWLSHPDPGLRSSWWETMPGVATIVILLVAVMTASYLLIGG